MLVLTNCTVRQFLYKVLTLLRVLGLASSGQWLPYLHTTAFSCILLGEAVGSQELPTPQPVHMPYHRFLMPTPQGYSERDQSLEKALQNMQVLEAFPAMQGCASVATLRPG